MHEQEAAAGPVGSGAKAACGFVVGGVRCGGCCRVSRRGAGREPAQPDPADAKVCSGRGTVVWEPASGGDGTLPGRTDAVPGYGAGVARLSTEAGSDARDLLVPASRCGACCWSGERCAGWCGGGVSNCCKPDRSAEGRPNRRFPRKEERLPGVRSRNSRATGS